MRLHVSVLVVSQLSKRVRSPSLNGDLKLTSLPFAHYPLFFFPPPLTDELELGEGAAVDLDALRVWGKSNNYVYGYKTIIMCQLFGKFHQ